MQPTNEPVTQLADGKDLILVKMLSQGFDPYSAVEALGYFDEYEFSDDAEIRRQEEQTIVEATVTSPHIVDLLTEMQKEEGEAYAMTTGEIRAFLRAAMYAKPEEIDESSPLCQSVKYTYSCTKDGDEYLSSKEVKMVDKLKAIDMDNRLKGRYNDKLSIGPSDELKELLEQAHASNAITQR